MKKKYDLILTPHYSINELILSSPNKNTVVIGNLGRIFRRGSFAGSMSDQIKREVTAPIAMDTPINFKDIKNKFDHVVIASGSLSESEEMNLLNLHLVLIPELQLWRVSLKQIP